MGKKIKKISTLEKPESYLQLNIVKGFKYIDKAGEIVNHYVLNDKPLDFTMDLNGLSIRNPKESIKEIRISSYGIWMKITNNIPLDNIVRVFQEETSKILSILEIEEVSRIGWRNYYIHNCNSKEERDKLLNDLTQKDIGENLLVKFKIPIDKNLQASLLIQPVKKPKGEEEEKNGLLFDIDIFQENELSIDSYSVCLDKIREYLLSKDGFLKVINEVLNQ